ncbi:MAG: phosphatidate cytidylyltransferase [Atopobiaceae bacterium]
MTSNADPREHGQQEDDAPTDVAVGGAADPQNAESGKEEATQEQKSRISLDSGIEKLEKRRTLREAQRVAGELRGQVMRGWTEKLLTRTLSGAIYAIVVLVCLYLGRVPTAIMVTAMAWLCCSEFFRMARMSGRMPNEIIGLSAAIAYPLAALLWGAGALIPITLIMLIWAAGWYVVTPRANIGDVAISCFAPLYTSLTFSCLVLIRTSDAGSTGALLTLGVMASMWANDAAAYFVGSRFGVHKMAPRISPHKSWEGFFGGLLGSVFIWFLVGILHVEGVGLVLALFSGVLVGVAAVVGDLFESRIKRGVGVKDSGDFMPGHGGMLDRSDSMLFGCVVAYFLLRLGGIL